MAHFTSQEKLKAFLNADQVNQLFLKIPPEEQENFYAYVDEVIISATGIEPMELNDPILTSIASRIAIWYLSGQQQWNDANRPELDRRKELYNQALQELENYEPPSESSTTSCYGSNGRRIGDW